MILTGSLSSDQRFRHCERLRLQRDVRAVFGHRNSAGGACLVVYGRPSGLRFNRLAIPVGRRFGSAVVRNRFKRLCREAFRLTKAQQPTGWDWIVLPRPLPAARCGKLTGAPAEKVKLVPWTLEQLKADLLAQMRRIARCEQRKK